MLFGASHRPDPHYQEFRPVLLVLQNQPATYLEFSMNRSQADPGFSDIEGVGHIGIALACGISAHQSNRQNRSDPVATALCTVFGFSQLHDR